MNDDRAGKTYWDSNYQPSAPPKPFNPHGGGTRNYGKRELSAYFHRIFSSIEPKGERLLEIGCGGSAMLPYFNKEFGFQIAGLDYSESGCQLARDILNRERIEGDVYCADVFSEQAALREQFHVVVSFGVAEHFNDTAGCIRAFARYLKPGGLIVTSIPNMSGLVGEVQKLLNPSIYKKHVPLDAQSVAAAHSAVGLDVLECGYFLFTNFGVANLNEIPRGSAQWYLKSSCSKALCAMTGLTWFAESVLGPFKANRATSPYIRCLARKPV